MLGPPQASVALWCGSATVATGLLSLLLIDSLTSGHVAQVAEPRRHVGLGGGDLRASSPSPGQAAGVGTPTCPQRREWAKWARGGSGRSGRHQLSTQHFPSQRQPRLTTSH